MPSGTHEEDEDEGEGEEREQHADEAGFGRWTPRVRFPRRR